MIRYRLMRCRRQFFSESSHQVHAVQKGFHSRVGAQLVILQIGQENREWIVLPDGSVQGSKGTIFFAQTGIAPCQCVVPPETRLL